VGSWVPGYQLSRLRTEQLSNKPPNHPFNQTNAKTLNPLHPSTQTCMACAGPMLSDEDAALSSSTVLRPWGRGRRSSLLPTDVTCCSWGVGVLRVGACGCVGGRVGRCGCMCRVGVSGGQGQEIER